MSSKIMNENSSEAFCRECGMRFFLGFKLPSNFDFDSPEWYPTCSHCQLKLLKEQYNDLKEMLKLINKPEKTTIIDRTPIIPFPPKKPLKQTIWKYKKPEPLIPKKTKIRKNVDFKENKFNKTDIQRKMGVTLKNIKKLEGNLGNRIRYK